MSIEIWGKPACPSCMKAKAFCEKYNYPHTYKEYGTDFTREEIMENFQVQERPQIIVNKEKIMDMRLLLNYIENTGYNGTGRLRRTHDY